ncbi:MAG: glycosyltransferase family 4 protein [Elsteraceae bacterium]
MTTAQRGLGVVMLFLRMASALLSWRPELHSPDQMEIPMKAIGCVLSTFPVFSETFVGTEMRAMIAHGHKVVPIVLQRPVKKGQSVDETMAEQAIYLDRVGGGAALGALIRPSLQVGRGVAFSFAQCKLPRRSLIWNALKIAAVARKHGLTHLHAHFAGGAAAHAILAARWIGATVSFVGHGHDIYAQPEDLAAKLSHVDFAVAVCDDMAQDFKAEVANVPVAQVPCGVNPSRFKPRADGGADNGRYLFIARLIETKGCADLIDAIALLLEGGVAKLKLDVVGDGPLREELAERAAAMGVSEQVRFLGAKPAEWLVEHGPHYRALVAPFKMIPGSLERDSGPVVSKEAMAMGLPEIATRFMGFKEMVTEETGRLFEPGDVVGLSRRLIEIDWMPSAQRQAMGQAGRARLEKHFTDRRQAELLSFWVEAA